MIENYKLRFVVCEELEVLFASELDVVRKLASQSQIKGGRAADIRAAGLEDLVRPRRRQPIDEGCLGGMCGCAGAADKRPEAGGGEEVRPAVVVGFPKKKFRF